MTRTIMRLVCALLAAGAFLWFSNPTALNYLTHIRTLFTTTGMTWHSNFAGWRIRAQAHPTPDAFIPSRNELVLGVLRSEPAQPNGFTLALFSPNVAVDALGRVLLLSEADFNGLTALGKQTLDLPETGSYRNTWRVKQLRTSQPIERLYVMSTSDALRQISVQGYSKGKRELSAPVGVYTELPVALWELYGLFGEAREDYERGKEDQTMIGKVKELFEQE